MQNRKNWQCDGSHCTHAKSEVRVYPLGGGANLILCHACWAHENRYRYNRGVETKDPDNWPQNNWSLGKVYPDGENNGVCRDAKR